jgi:hypothetical protein
LGTITSSNVARVTLSMSSPCNPSNPSKNPSKKRFKQRDYTCYSRRSRALERAAAGLERGPRWSMPRERGIFSATGSYR